MESPDVASCSNAIDAATFLTVVEEHFVIDGGLDSVVMEEESCEVCTNELDATDSSISFCDCNYSLCLW